MCPGRARFTPDLVDGDAALCRTVHLSENEVLCSDVVGSHPHLAVHGSYKSQASHCYQYLCLSRLLVLTLSSNGPDGLGITMSQSLYFSMIEEAGGMLQHRIVLIGYSTPMYSRK
jgi:hypothetical protein